MTVWLHRPYKFAEDLVAEELRLVDLVTGFHQAKVAGWMAGLALGIG
ncbi:MAG: hypothetical protein R3B99_26050 [Polyangiales bacterium]